MESPPLLEPGASLGRYVITRRLGAGGMGEVYEARHTDLDKRVAVKVMNAAQGVSPELKARFIREGQSAARVRHAHAVDIFDVGVEGDLLYLVMEYLEGEDLAALLAREAPLAPERIADLMLPVAAALATVHDEGIVHRDLKPANVFLARGRQGALAPKVLDFGVSKVAGAALTADATMLGTPLYMSPEQVRAAKDVDARSDVYSFGAILYECATGRRAFSGANIMVIFGHIAAGDFPRPRAVNPALPEAFEALVVRAMAARRDDRFPSMNDLGRALVPFASPASRVVWGPVFGVDPEAALGASMLASSAPRLPTLPAASPPLPPPPSTPFPQTLAVTPQPQTLVAPPPQAPRALDLPPPPQAPPRRSPVVWAAAGVGAVAMVAAGFLVTLRALEARDRPAPSPVARAAPDAGRAPTPAVSADAAAPREDGAAADAATDAGVAAGDVAPPDDATDAAGAEAEEDSEREEPSGRHHRRRRHHRSRHDD